MPAARDDYLLRQIQLAAAALQRLISRVGSGESSDTVVVDIRAAIAALLGPNGPLLERLDARSAANLVGDPERVQVWSQLLALQAESERHAGRDTVADALAARARALAAFGQPST